GGARARVAGRAGLPAGGRARPDRVSRARADDRPRHRALPAARAGVMGYRIGVDVGGTFTDLLLARHGAPPRAAKTPSTPADSSEGFLTGLAEPAAGEGRMLHAFLADVEVIVHGPPVPTHAA